MKANPPSRFHPPAARAERGSVLVLVMWILFGLISITIYFAHSMIYELRASDNRVAGIEAEQAIEGGRRYVSLMISNITDRGSIPSPANYQCQAVPVGNGRFWLLGRTNVDNAPPAEPTWGLMDEGAKINLNTANSNMLYMLPRMTPELVNSILAWRSTNTTSTTGGAETDTYMRLNPPYTCKNAPFETIGELRLIYNMDLLTLFGEDPNMNGILDPNENDGEILPPSDNQNGKLEPGILEYVTVYSREPSTTTNGTARIQLGPTTDIQSLRTNMESLYGASQATTFLRNVTQTTRQGGQQVTTLNPLITNPLLFFRLSGMNEDQFAQIEPMLRGASLNGLVNINTASSVVLACLPGMDINTAAQVVAYRTSNQGTIAARNSIGWIVNAITDKTILPKIAPRITGRSYQYTADIAAVGHDGRGFRRTRFIFDVTQGAPNIIYRQDLTHLGWALGKQVRDRWQLGKKTS